MRWRRRRTDEDFAAEVQAHLDTEADRLVGEGMTPREARAAARRQFGNVTRVRERFHETHRALWLEQVAHDLRYAWRGLRQSPAFVATTVLTLAVGMGLVTAVFAVLNAYVLRPFAVHDPYSLYAIRWSAQEASGHSFRWRDFESMRARPDLFDDVVAEATRTVQSNGQPVAIGFVSGNYFAALAPRVALGRGLVPDDARAPGAEPVAVLTDRSWTRLFGRDPAVLGREIDANGREARRRRRHGSRIRRPRRLAAGSVGASHDVRHRRRGGSRRRQPVATASGDGTAQARHHATAGRGITGDRAVRDPRGWTRGHGPSTTPGAGDADAHHADGHRVPLAGVCRVWSRARGGVRQCVERHARTRECPPPRDRHPPLDRCEPGPSRPPARHRGSPHRHAGRARWVGARRRAPAPGRIRIGGNAPADGGGEGALGAARLRLSGVPLRVRRRGRGHRPLCAACRHCRRRD